MSHAESIYAKLVKHFPVYRNSIAVFDRPAKDQLVLTIDQGGGHRIYLSEGNVEYLANEFNEWLQTKEAQRYADGLWFS